MEYEKQTNTTLVYKRLIHIQCVKPKKGIGERERGEGKVVGKGGRSRRRTWRGISKPFSLKTVLFYLHELNTQQSRLITRKYTRTPRAMGKKGEEKEDLLASRMEMQGCGCCHIWFDARP